MELVCFQKKTRDDKPTLELNIWVRPDTTDEQVIDEVLRRNVYEKPSIGFVIEPTDMWLDLGANIGTFTLLCLARGARVAAYEPETSNAQLLRKNVLHNFGRTRRCRVVRAAVGCGGADQSHVDLYLARNPENKYRHSLCPIRGRSATRVPFEDIRCVLRRCCPTAIKMDIEGTEIELLESLTAADYRSMGIKKMVFEYSFDIDRSIPRFLGIIRRLRTYFGTVNYTKVKENELEYHHFPAMTMVFCLFNKIHKK